MKNLIVLSGLLLTMVTESWAQNAILHVSLDNCSASHYYVYIQAHPRNRSAEVPLKEGRNAAYEIEAISPEFVSVYFSASDDRSSKNFRYVFYLSPGDNLSFTGNFSKPGFGIKVTGKGSKNNQPMIGMVQRLEFDSLYGDTTPGRAMGEINAARRSEEGVLEKYIDLYNPSNSFISDWRTNINYLAIDRFYDFKEENKFRIQDAYKRNYDQWKKVSDSLFAVVKLNNDSALIAPHYMSLLNMFLLREKERLWSESYDHPETFYREWYNTDTTAGKRLYKADVSNSLQEKIINKYFSGRSAEFLYAVLLENTEIESNPANVPEMFERFKNKYPNSIYIKEFTPYIEATMERQKRPLNEKMVFMADNGTKLNTLEDVLAVMKGKTVLVDMWGTWCGPCREEIEKHSANLHSHFKGKNIVFLYVANHDLSDMEQWKKLIVYFNLEGTHILANKHLTDDIMDKVKGEGFPTVFVIKKDGTFELSKSRYPIHEDILEKQLEDALAE
ncbi:MAG TPA: TlpA disulfide reductase family protein [Mucilaginibacter sp.]|jgi:thiol-disulfide isomerase/thioredoxin|nr:TlpA disulfide reductase family protein [Mucilaginibacter sp.]